MYKILKLMVIAELFLTSKLAFAYEVDFNEKSFGWIVYDLAFNKILKGPLGYVFISILFVAGILALAQSHMKLMITFWVSAALLGSLKLLMSGAGMVIW